MIETHRTQIQEPDLHLKDDRTARRAARYQAWVDRTSRALDLLALIFLIDFLLGRAAPDGPTWWQPTLSAVSFAIWFAFAVDYLVRLSLSPQRWPFFVTHKLDLVMVLLPMLRMLRVLLLLRKSFKTIPTERIAGSLFTIVVGVVALGAVLEWQVERNAPGANITTLGTAIWWAITTTTTVGYGDTYPVTPVGRVIASVVMVVGIGLIGTVSATVAAWFVKNNQRTAERAAKLQRGERKRRRTGRTAAGESAPDGGADQPGTGDLPPGTDQPGSPEPGGSAPSGQTPVLGHPDNAVAAMDLAQALAAISAQIQALSSQQAHLQAAVDRLGGRSSG